MNIFPSLIFSRRFLLLVMCIKHLLCVRVQTALQIRWVTLFSVVCKTGEGTVHPWRPSLGSVGRFGALLGPPALWDTQGHSQGALTLQDAAQKDGSKQQWGIKHPLCVGCEALRAPEPENKLLVKARVSAPAMRRTFRRSGEMPRISDSLKMRKKPLLPCSWCPGLSLKPGWVFWPQQSSTPQSQAARIESHCNSNNSLFTS